MKIGKRLLIAITVVAFTPAIPTMAQFYKPMGDDGITASPKLRQQLDARAAEQRAVAAAAVVASKPAAAESPVTAPPRTLATMKAPNAAPSTAATAVASTTAAPNDGIAASPKLREQLRGHATAVEIAPIK